MRIPLGYPQRTRIEGNTRDQVKLLGGVTTNEWLIDLCWTANSSRYQVRSAVIHLKERMFFIRLDRIDTFDYIPSFGRDKDGYLLKPKKNKKIKTKKVKK